LVATSHKRTNEALHGGASSSARKRNRPREVCLYWVTVATHGFESLLDAIMLDRRKLLIGATAFAGYSATARAALYEWPTTSPSEAGFVRGFGERLDQFVLTGLAANIHGVVIVRHGRLAFENYYEGDDQVRDEKGRTHFERVAFSAERSHEIALGQQEHRRPALRDRAARGKGTAAG
jgi:hypothetical protein